MNGALPHSPHAVMVHAVKSLPTPYNLTWSAGTTVLHLGAFAASRKATIRFVMSVRLSAWNSWAPTGRIFMKFYI